MEANLKEKLYLFKKTKLNNKTLHKKNYKESKTGKCFSNLLKTRYHNIILKERPNIFLQMSILQMLLFFPKANT